RGPPGGRGFVGRGGPGGRGGRGRGGPGGRGRGPGGGRGGGPPKGRGGRGLFKGQGGRGRGPGGRGFKGRGGPEVEVGEEADEAALVDEAEREVGAAARERGKSEAGIRCLEPGHDQPAIVLLPLYKNYIRSRPRGHPRTLDQKSEASVIPL
ncbi:hypothetical protein THAOC_22034, partial [Thalassiosira oceanica]